MTEYDIHKAHEITGLAESALRRIHGKHGLGYHKNGARKLTFTTRDIDEIFRLSRTARLYRDARKKHVRE